MFYIFEELEKPWSFGCLYWVCHMAAVPYGYCGLSSWQVSKDCLFVLTLQFETSSPHWLEFWFPLADSKRTPSRPWSCATTSPCSASTRRPSSSSSTFQSHPTFWGLLSTPRSKDTGRWGWMCAFLLVCIKRSCLFYAGWRMMMRMDTITGRINRGSTSAQKISHMPLSYNLNIYSRIQLFKYWLLSCPAAAGMIGFF